MKATLVILAVGLKGVITYPCDEITSDEDWTLIPDKDGHLSVDYEIAARDPVVVTFTLYTSANPTIGEEMVPNDADWLANSNYNPNNPTRIICHGWLGDIHSPLITSNRDAYLSRGDFNIIGIDWSKGGSNAGYLQARRKTKDVAIQVATYLDFLSRHGTSYSKVYLIGHSLGAHIAGLIGKLVKNGRINTIYGIDPALPLYSENRPHERLAVGDAEYVETIQTNGGIKGFDIPIGNSSFYPNWGGPQPGCGFDLLSTCSHNRAWILLAESIRNNQFYAVKCHDYDSIKTKNCSKSGPLVRMGGEPSQNDRRGIYYLPTNNKEPFALGKFFVDF